IVVTFFQVRRIMYNSCFGECVFFSSNIAIVADLILFFFVPVTVIIALYMRVFVVAVSQARAMRSHVTSVTLQCSLNQLKASGTLGILVVVFLICYCPFFCFSFGVEDMVNNPSTFFVIMVFYFNSCLNPLIYALFYPWFRNAVKLIITLQIFKHETTASLAVPNSALQEDSKKESSSFDSAVVVKQTIKQIKVNCYKLQGAIK
uniref:G-protein coupled receptors family 1 profile domain-containing protein n=1 Tax=Maylandia zebra TaxID=106582 RepID=A0A3P9CZ39_9CICH